MLLLYNAATVKSFFCASLIIEAKSVAVPTATMNMILPITLSHAKAGLYFYVSYSFTCYISTQLKLILTTLFVYITSMWKF